MPFSDPRAYFDLLLKPMLERFNAEPTAYDLAFSTCVTIDNMGDLYAVQKGVRPKEARTVIEAKFPQFQKVVVIANAFKHVELESKAHGIYLGTRAEHAVIDDGAAFSDGSYYSDGASHDDACQTVVITFPNGEKCDINHLCSQVAEDLLALFSLDT